MSASRPLCLSTLLACFAVVGGCCLGPLPLSAAELGPLLTRVAPEKDRQDPRGRKLLVIYYGNDIEAPTTDNPSYQDLHALIKKVGEATQNPAFDNEQKQRLGTIAGKLEQRYSDVITQTRAEIDLLNRAADEKHFELATIRCWGNGGQQVTNARPRQQLFRTIDWWRGPIRVLNSGGVSVTHKLQPLRIPYELPNKRYRFAPLCHPAIFREALEDIIKEFPDNEYCYLLIVRSPATDESMLTGILTADIEPLPAGPLAEAILEACDGIDLAKADSEEVAYRVNQQIVDVFLAPKLRENREAFEKDKQRIAFFEFSDQYVQRLNATHEFGAGKREVFDTLSSMYTARRYFPLVLFAGRGSRLETSSDKEVQQILAEPAGYEAFHFGHIDWLFLQGEKAIDITATLRQATEDKDPDFVRSLLKRLKP